MRQSKNLSQPYSVAVQLPCDALSALKTFVCGHGVAGKHLLQLHFQIQTDLRFLLDGLIGVYLNEKTIFPFLIFPEEILNYFTAKRQMKHKGQGRKEKGSNLPMFLRKDFRCSMFPQKKKFR